MGIIFSLDMILYKLIFGSRRALSLTSVHGTFLGLPSRRRELAAIKKKSRQESTCFHPELIRKQKNIELKSIKSQSGKKK
jgi:hypothetical protein